MKSFDLRVPQPQASGDIFPKKLGSTIECVLESVIDPPFVHNTTIKVLKRMIFFEKKNYP